VIRRALPLFLLLLALLAGCGEQGEDAAPEATPSGAEERIPALGSSGDDEPEAEPQAEAEDTPVLGFPVFATKNTTRVAGADPVADAAGVARAVYPARTDESSPRAVVVVDQRDWRAAISAAQLMARPLAAPILFSNDRELPAASAEALEELAPSGAEEAGGAQVIRIGTAAAEPENREVTTVQGRSSASLAAAVDRLQAAAAGGPSDAVVVAPADAPEFAMPAAGWAAKSGHPVLWSTRDDLPDETRAAIERHERPRIYVLGPEQAISDAVLEELDELGPATRISGPDPVTNAIEFARFGDGRFGWNVVDPGHGLVFANAARTLDAAAAAPLSATGTYGPLLLLTDAAALPEAVQEYLLDIQPGYDEDPVRGVYNHGWLIGDERAVSADVQSRIDALLEIQPVDTGGD
jgi:hypothetical protein